MIYCYTNFVYGDIKVGNMQCCQLLIFLWWLVLVQLWFPLNGRRITENKSRVGS